MRKNMPELRVLGTSVTLTEAMRRRAEQDLGLRIRFEVLDGFDAQRQAVMRQDSFDLYDQWFHSLDCLWPTGALQPIDIGRLAHWDEVNALPKTGRITPQAALGAGCNPAMRLYVQADGTRACMLMKSLCSFEWIRDTYGDALPEVPWLPRPRTLKTEQRPTGTCP